MHGVLQPWTIPSGTDHGTDPLTPRNLTRIRSHLPCRVTGRHQPGAAAVERARVLLRVMQPGAHGLLVPGLPAPGLPAPLSGEGRDGDQRAGDRSREINP